MRRMIDRERFRLAMEKAGLSQASLARAAKVSPASVQQILNGKTRTSRSISELAEALRVSRDWLEGKTDNPSRHFFLEHHDGDLELMSVIYLDAHKQKPIEDSAGAYSETGVRKLQFTKSWLVNVTGAKAGDVIIMGKVGGMLMAPTLIPGDEMLMIVMNEYDDDPDGIYLLNYAGRSMTRRIHPAGTDGFYIIADNVQSPPLRASRAECEITAKIVWVGRSLKP